MNEEVCVDLVVCSVCSNKFLSSLLRSSCVSDILMLPSCYYHFVLGFILSMFILVVIVLCMH